MSESDRKEFFDAIIRGDLEFVAASLVRDPSLIHAHQRGATGMHFAAIHDNRSLVDLLLEHGADIDAIDFDYGAPPIGWANEKGHDAMVEYLYARGASVDLHRAAAYGLLVRVEFLLRQDASVVNSISGFGTPLHEAALWGRSEVFTLLLEYGADPRLKNSLQKNALAIALEQVVSDCRATPIAIETRRREIRKGCVKIIELLRKLQMEKEAT